NAPVGNHSAAGLVNGSRNVSTAFPAMQKPRSAMTKKGIACFRSSRRTLVTNWMPVFRRSNFEPFSSSACKPSRLRRRTCSKASFFEGRTSQPAATWYGCDESSQFEPALPDSSQKNDHSGEGRGLRVGKGCRRRDREPLFFCRGRLTV